MTLRVSLVVFAVILLMVPLATHAAMSAKANGMCHPVYPEGNTCQGCGMVKTKGSCVQMSPLQNKHMCPNICWDTPPTGIVYGTCVAPGKCEGKTFTDQAGKQQSVGGMEEFAKMLSKLMEALKGGGGGAPPPPGGGKPKEEQPQQGQQGGEGCMSGSYYQVTAPSSDPCARYVQPTSSSLLTNTSGIGAGASNALLEALGSGSALNVSDDLTGALNYQPANVSEKLMGAGSGEQGGAGELGGAQTATQAPAGATSSQGQGLAGQAVSLKAGTQGNIELTPTRATVVASARDLEANTEVAGFYGSTISGGEQPQGLVAKMCQSRPWADSVVTYVIPPTFFDSLCAWRGYQVGTPPSPTPPMILQKVRQGAPSASPTPTGPLVAPEVEIWAVPERVSLGARTSIFWNTKGVESCTVTSPDGSFEEQTLSGGSATVPLTGATTFVISCLTPQGEPVTDHVTVEISI